jgi:hypothetical protein
MMRQSIFCVLLSVACASSEDGIPQEEADLRAKADEHWFYNGPMPVLDSAKVTVSIQGHTVRVSGLLPNGASLPALPHVRTRPENGRTRVDAVYPIATARSHEGKSNSRLRTYTMFDPRPYRPDGIAFTRQEGAHMVPWAGFPFLPYNQGIAFHGPITTQASAMSPDLETLYLRRGRVSGGCNRMMGEHVLELGHITGVASMRKVYEANTVVPAARNVSVAVIDAYDMYAGKYVDVDYPTYKSDAEGDLGVIRPAVTHGADKVEMFGSWIASETPNGSDLPPSMAWQGGVSGVRYIFKEHAQLGWVCSLPADTLPKLRAWAKTLPNGEIPNSVCQNTACVRDALRSNKDPKAACRL